MKRPRNPIDVKIGANIRHIRCSKGMSSEMVGKAFADPITYQQVCKYERGESSLSSRCMVELAEILGCEVIQFFEGLDGLIFSESSLKPYSADTLANGKLAKDINALPSAVQSSVRELVAACALSLSKKFGATQ